MINSKVFVALHRNQKKQHQTLRIQQPKLGTKKWQT